MSRKRSSFDLDVPGETNPRLTAADRRRFSVRLDRDEGRSLSTRVIRRSQANPYPQTNPTRTSKDNSPPPRSRSAPTTPKPNSTGAGSSDAEHLPSNHRSFRRTPSRRVRFTPEADIERPPGPKESTKPSNSAARRSGSPARKLPATQIVQSRGRSQSQTPNTGQDHTADIVFSLTPIRRSSPEESIAVVAEISSDESEGSDDRAPETVQSRTPPRKDNSIRSGIEDLLEANKEVPMVDVDTANALVSLLSQMDSDSANRVLANPSPVSPATRTRTGTSAQIEVVQMPMRSARKFHSSTGEGETVWWESHSGSNLTSPLHNVDRTVGDLYIHRNATDSLIQIWICRDSGSWEEVALEYDDKYHPDRVIRGLSHPSFPDHRLKLRKNGEPSWIMKQTCATIKSRRKGTQ